MHVVSWGELPTQEANGVRRTALAGVEGTLVRVEIPAGVRAGRHSHAHEQFVHVIEGTGTLTTQEGAKSFAAGSLFHFPADTWHEAVFETQTVLVETNFG